MPYQWTVAAPNSGAGPAHCLYEFNGELFEGDGDNTTLLKLVGNTLTFAGGGPISWGLYCLSLIECNGFLYGLSGPAPTKLVEWDPVGQAWQILPVASLGVSVPIAIYECFSMVKLNNQIYMIGGGAGAGSSSIYLWDGIRGRLPLTEFYGFSEVSPGYIGDTGGGFLINNDNMVNLFASIVFNSVIYVGTSSPTANPNNGGGYLLQWDGITGHKMTIAAPKINNTTGLSLVVYNGNLYAGTSPNGELLQWDGVSAWVRVAPQLGAETGVGTLVVHNGHLYGTTSPNNLLYMWDVVSAWVQVLPQYLTQSIEALVSFNGDLYGATWGPAADLLLKYSLVTPTLLSFPAGNIQHKLISAGLI